jgi:hypothetical protein
VTATRSRNVSITENRVSAFDGFTMWMAKVDALMVKYCTMSSMDLPDWNYRDAYDDGMSPSRAARSAISAARDF